MAARVLVVEEDADVRDLIVSALTEHGYEVVIACSGEECLQLAQSERVDLICLEVTLSGIDGFDTAEQLLGNRATRDIPLIFLTERKSLHDRVRGLQIGAHAYVTKPFAFLELLATLEGILRRTQQRLSALGVVGLMGSLRDVGIGAVMQAIEHEQRSGILNVTSGEKWGRITFWGGKVVGAEAGKAEGEEAVFELIRWPEGSYAFRPQPIPPQTPLAESCATLLVRAYQQFDEIRAAGIPDSDAAPGATLAP